MDTFYAQLRAELEIKLSFLEDKPEETVDSTIKALWQKAYGFSMSAEEASKLPLPELSDQQKVLLSELTSQRIMGKPLAYIVGRQKFMGIELICDTRALIPRKETEILGRKALAICEDLTKKKSEVKVFDVCCGSGNLAIALAFSLSNVIVHASDLSREAVALTNENISLLQLNARVKAIISDLFSSFESEDYYGNVDIIVCNPPYISTSKINKMDFEISENEPLMAFDGGMVGLKVIQNLIREAPKFLSKNGWIVFEVGLGQGPFIIQLCEKSDLYKEIEPVTDAAGNIRVIAARC
ncbi:MAG TPA: peptide chain release factor N(5)-glutamine methyltransferase [Prolixibacteraceae bacterium]|nr:peptide chain release factor N(5)-glutamine methyltransferase [Prolixibacteraceae bacterium]